MLLWPVYPDQTFEGLLLGEGPRLALTLADTRGLAETFGHSTLAGCTLSEGPMGEVTPNSVQLQLRHRRRPRSHV